MKNVFKAFGIIALVAVIGFSIAACGNNNEDNKEIIIPDNPATQFVSKIIIGWNLGNTLDATDFGEGWLKNATVTEMETAWVKTLTTKANIDTIKNAGFNAIRIPVSWTKAVDSNYNIRADWMARVVEVVNYAVDNDMYIILNTHHDDEVFTLLNSNVEAGKAAFKKIWEQIADKFKNYNEKLIFEGLNEPRAKGSENEWWAEGTPGSLKNLNDYQQIFVNTVRASGGNNVQRFLMISPYGAKATDQTELDALILPNDSVQNRLIVSVHVYQPEKFAFPLIENPNATVTTWSKNKSSDTLPITVPIDRVYNRFVKKGVPVIMGEFGSADKNNTATRVEWAKFYVSYAKSRGIPCFWWDNGNFPEDLAIFNRYKNTFFFPEIASAILSAAGGIFTQP